MRIAAQQLLRSGNPAGLPNLNIENMATTVHVIDAQSAQLQSWQTLLGGAGPAFQRHNRCRATFK